MGCAGPVDNEVNASDAKPAGALQSRSRLDRVRALVDNDQDLAHGPVRPIDRRVASGDSSVVSSHDVELVCRPVTGAHPGYGLPDVADPPGVKLNVTPDRPGALVATSTMLL